MKTILVLGSSAVLAGCDGGSSKGPNVAPERNPPPLAQQGESSEIPEAIRSFCSPARPARADVLPPGAPEVPARMLTAGGSLLEAPMDCVVRTSAEWAALVSAGQIRDLPGVEPARFDREVVLVASLGRQPSTGHSVRIDTVAASGGTVTAVVHSLWPAGGLALPAVTYPFVAVAVPAPADSVVFLRRP